MEPFEELDLHLRRHRMGSCEGGGIHFDWAEMASRGLHLIPAFETDSAAVYRSVLELRPPARFYRGDSEAGAVPDPDDDDFFVEVESAVACLADPEGGFAYVSFFSEEAYLALTRERALDLFQADPGEMLAQSLLCCVADGSLRMRRHRHGIRIFEAAARHHVELQRRLGLDEPGLPPWR